MGNKQSAAVQQLLTQLGDSVPQLQQLREQLAAVQQGAQPLHHEEPLKTEEPITAPISTKSKNVLGARGVKLGHR